MPGGGTALPGRRPASVKDRVSCVPPTLRPALRSHEDRHHMLRATGHSASWQAGRGGMRTVAPDLRGWGPIPRLGLCSCICNKAKTVLFLSSSWEVLKTSAPKFIFSQDGISMEARLACSFPGLRGWGYLCQPADRRPWSSLTVVLAGGLVYRCPRRRQSVCLSRTPTPPLPGPPGTSCAGAAAELPSWGRGSEKHCSVGSTAGEPDPQVRGRGVPLTLQPPEGRQVGSRISG